MPLPLRLAARAARAVAPRAAALLAACEDPAAPDAPVSRPPAEPPAVTWLRSAAVPLAGASPTLSDADLAPLRAMVGDAPLVGLGEGTHGTREHFQLKHRIVQYLVRELGFTAFAIEATMPEAFAVDRWVRGGPGDPAVLLSNLYFWTWNTEEVLALMQWMRAHNATVPSARQVRFFGFDMQFPGAAIDSVRAYVRRVDPPRAASADSAYACLAAARNNGPRPGAQRYVALPQDDRARCAAAVAAAHAAIAERRAAYAAASSAEEYARALQSARLVVQWEDMAGRAVPGGPLARDRYMAENTEWLLAQLPPGARMVLWAHNYHVSRVSGAQGGHLHARFGARYVNLGFSFGTGTFTAVEMANGQFLQLRTLSTADVPAGSFEAYAQGTGLAYFLFDARRIAGAPEAQALAGPIAMRSIGSGFDPSRGAAYFATTVLPHDFDLLIHVAAGTASRLLPFRYE
jgi:erythromycin esterase